MKSIIPGLEKEIEMYKIFVDDAIYFGRNKIVLATVNSFHRSTKFTIEIDKDRVITFLKVLVIRTPNGTRTAVYDFKMNFNKYIQWNFFDVLLTSV